MTQHNRKCRECECVVCGKKFKLRNFRHGICDRCKRHNNYTNNGICEREKPEPIKVILV